MCIKKVLVISNLNNKYVQKQLTIFIVCCYKSSRRMIILKILYKLEGW